ncbi:MAG: hypothetical protein KF893_12125 [Caldilineaceae bacterium]|nr:hypothetical protein [Caldilineaceae bacterium]
MPEQSDLGKGKLDQWEKRLRQQVSEGDLLLGELGYTQQHLEEIGKLLYTTLFHSLEKGAKIEVKLRQAQHTWPLTFALYLVLEGIYSYGDEGLWHGPKNRLKIRDDHTSLCGECFLKILIKYNLPTFERSVEQSGGHRYVTPILLHGGIPDSFLDEFFDFLYRHEVQPHRIAIDASALVTLWRHNTTELTGLHRPVSRFLQYGGLVAEDFVARCLDLLRTNSESEWDTFGLPERVLQSYRIWLARQTVETRSRPLQSSIRLQRPRLTVAPYTTGITLYLPPQQLPNRDAPRELVWRVTDGSRIQVIGTNRQRIENGYQYTATNSASVLPAQGYELELLADSSCLQKWVVSGFGTSPLLVFESFDDYEADSLDEQEQHRPGKRWLLYPDSVSLQAKGGSRRLRQLPRLTDSWRGFCLEEWQLEPGELALREGNGQRDLQFSIIHEKSHSRPYLDGGKRVLPGFEHEDFPLYCGHPPALVIQTTQPQRWRVSVRGAGNAQPPGYRSFVLSDLPLRREDETVCLELTHPQLLGNQPVGKFEVSVRGPLGRNYTLGLRCSPSITIEGHDSLYLAQPDAPAHLRVICDETLSVRSSPPQTGVALREERLSDGQRAYTLVAEAFIQQVTLQITHAYGVAMPLSIPIQRLRWSLYTGLEAGGDVNWKTQPFALFPEGLGSDAELRVWLPLVAGGPTFHLGWRLLDANGQVWREVRPDQTSLQRIVAIPLTEVLTLWRERQETLLWQLEITAEGEAEPITVDALYLLPNHDLGEIQYDWHDKDEQVHLTLYWENSQLGRTQLRLWPLDRPWVDIPITLAIPEMATISAEWVLPSSELPAEAYLGEIVIYNPWASQATQRPASNQSNTILIKPPGLTQYYAEIVKLRNQGQADVGQLLALFCHQYYNNQHQELHNTNKALSDQRQILSLIWLTRWAETTAKLDNNAYKLAQLRIFEQSIIDRLAQDDHPADEMERYFQHLPHSFPEKIHMWVLRSGLRLPRRRCLESLCHLSLDSAEKEDAFQAAMEALLEDVTNGDLLIGDAVTLLKENPQSAAEYLAMQGSQDAAELLRELTYRNPLQITWLWPRMHLDTSIGPIFIHNLRDRSTGQARFCAPLAEDYYAYGSIQLSPFPLSVRLHLSNSLLHFTDHSPYQCGYCQELFSDMVGYAQHHEAAHAGQFQSRRRLKQDEKLTWIRVRVDESKEEQHL